MSAVGGDAKDEEKESSGIVKLMTHEPLLITNGSHVRVYKKAFFGTLDTSLMHHQVWGDTAGAAAPPAGGIKTNHILPGLNFCRNQVMWAINRGEMCLLKAHNQAFRYGTLKFKLSNISFRTENASGTGEFQLASHHIVSPDCWVYDSRHVQHQFPWRAWSSSTGLLFAQAWATSYIGDAATLQLGPSCLETYLYGQNFLYEAGNGSYTYKNSGLSGIGLAPLALTYPRLLSACSQYMAFPFRASEYIYNYQTNDYLFPEIMGKSVATGGTWEFPDIKSDGHYRSFAAVENYGWDTYALLATGGQQNNSFPPENFRANPSLVGTLNKSPIVYDTLNSSYAGPVLYHNQVNPGKYLFRIGQAGLGNSYPDPYGSVTPTAGNVE